MDEKKNKLGLKYFLSRFRAFMPSKWLLTLGLSLVIIETCLSLIIPIMTKDFVDESSLIGIKQQTIFLLITVFMGQFIMSGFALYTMTIVGERVVYTIRSRVWQKTLQLPISFFDRHSSGELMSRITNDTLVIKEFIIDQVIPSISGIITILGSVILLLMLDWKMTLLMFIAVPVIMLIVLFLGKRMYRVSRTLQDETALFQTDLSRVLTDIRLVKASVAEGQEKQTGTKRMKKLFLFGVKEGKIKSIIQPMAMSSTLILLAVIFGYGSIRVAADTLSAGTLVAIIFYLFQITTPFSQLSQFFAEMQKALGASERLDHILLLDTERNSHKQYKLSNTDNTLSFRELSFSYEADKPVLKSIDFQAELGQVTAFIGSSGAGKTTLFSLLERFYEPNQGQITYKGQSIHQIPLHEWRNKIAYVPQQSPIMSGTIYSNLTYGMDEPSYEWIEQAVRYSNLKDFIESLPQQYQTEVGENGIRLSGGQRQRLAIARALIRDPDILLLDEATAHLDSVSENLVHEALKTLMQGRTTLIIAHRLATVINADQLVVLEGGVITGIGKHEDLVEKHTFYKKLVEQQMSIT